MALSDVQSMAREEGEGMETTETESLSPAIAPLTSLEDLLMSPDPKQGTFKRRAAQVSHFIPAGLITEKKQSKKSTFSVSAVSLNLVLCVAISLEPFVWNVQPTTEELAQKLNTATRSMEHMNSLLHETEATNAVLMEQITVCRQEITQTQECAGTCTIQLSHHPMFIWSKILLNTITDDHHKI